MAAPSISATCAWMSASAPNKALAQKDALLKLEEFEIIAKLIGARDPAKTAARMVLVDASTGADAARAQGISPQSVSNAVKRYRDADAAIRLAYRVQK